MIYTLRELETNKIIQSFDDLEYAEEMKAYYLEQFGKKTYLEEVEA
jgi:hypothetical protein